ncbi:MAG: GNAT family N-acetyltransferase [Calditrichia bacterium]
MIVREMTLEDAKQTTSLANQLGYSVPEESVTAHIKEIAAHSDHFIFVAILDNRVIGFIHGCRMLRLTSLPFLEICGLVVSIEHRREGIGKKLVRHLETFSENMPVRVRCNIKRTSAHEFYQHLGYSEKKEQKVFIAQRSAG